MFHSALNVLRITLLQEITVRELVALLDLKQRGEFHLSHDASRLISVFSPRWKKRSRVSREIFNDLNFKMQLIQGKFQ